MNILEFRDLCLELPQTTSDFPFDATTEVFRLGGKIFALCDKTQGMVFNVNLKCDPDLALDLRRTWPQQIQAGYHMNKRHWNTLTVDGTISDEKIQWLVCHSYECIQSKSKAKVKKSVVYKQ